LLQFDEYDFKGSVVNKTRKVISDAAILSVFGGAAANNWQVDAFRVDWQHAANSTLSAHAANLLDTTLYRTSQLYDALNRIKLVDYPTDVDGYRKRLVPTYNRAGALEGVIFDGQVFVEHISYNAKGQRTLIAYGDRDINNPGPRVMTRYAYDTRTFRLLRQRTEEFSSPAPFSFAPAGGTLQEIAYEYDLAGNLVALHDRTPGSGTAAQPDSLDREFSYDPLYRLLTATGRERDTGLPTPWDPGPRCHDVTRTRGYRQEYSYDPAGNMTLLKHILIGGSTGALPTRYYDLVPGTNRLTAMRVGTTNYPYHYDAVGNMIMENTERYFEWNHSNRLRTFRVQTANAEPSKHVHYLYDSGGQRVKKLVRKQGGKVEVTVYVDGIFEHHTTVHGASSNEHNTLHVLDSESRLAVFRVGVDPNDNTPSVIFHLGDHLGSSTVVLDQNGDWINREEYTPYGETSFGSYALKRFRFSGKEREEESGLYYHGARYYAPWLGKWISPDPVLRDDGLNPYAYVRSNPTGRVDPDGNSSRSIFLEYPVLSYGGIAAGGAVTGALIGGAVAGPLGAVIGGVVGAVVAFISTIAVNFLRFTNAMSKLFSGRSLIFWTSRLLSQFTNWLGRGVRAVGRAITSVPGWTATKLRAAGHRIDRAANSVRRAIGGLLTSPQRKMPESNGVTTRETQFHTPVGNKPGTLSPKPTSSSTEPADRHRWQANPEPDSTLDLDLLLPPLGGESTVDPDPRPGDVSPETPEPDPLQELRDLEDAFDWEWEQTPEGGSSIKA
jgi:RHS repeat-associated protein